MKTFLTLFVLFFSSSVVAGDDLSGKSIVCGIIVEDSELIKREIRYYVFGYDFLKNNIVKLYDHNGVFTNDPGSTLDFTYKTNLVSIFIEGSPGYIDRKTIDHISDKGEKIISGEDCIIYTNETIGFNLIKMEQKLITEITKDNKL